MSDLTSFLNLKALESAIIKPDPFPFVVIPNFIHSHALSALTDAFPSIQNRGSIPASSVECDPSFQRFLNELEGTELRNLIATKFDIDLQNKPSMLTLRGYTTERDGHIHTDSKDKLITILLYMNPTWDSPEGKLRLLNNRHSLNNYFEEVSPLAGTCLIFKVTENCWHGHTPFIGKRLSLQLNYVSGDAARSKHLNHHRLTATLKRWFPKLFPNIQESY